MRFFLLLTALAPLTALAQNAHNPNEPTPLEPKQPLTQDALYQDPNLTAHLLDQAIVDNNLENISALLDIYENSANANQQLIRYAKANLAQQQNRLKDAIALYREMLAQESNLPPVRLKLALALIADHQDSAAQDQLQRLHSEPLPEDIQQLIEQQLTNLQKKQQWNFEFSAYYQSDNNINNAPSVQKIILNTKEQCDQKIKEAIARGESNYFCPTERSYPAREQAKGIHYNVSADKTFTHANGYYSAINASIDGDQWDKSNYNNLNLTLGTSLGWQDLKHNLRINPFINQRFYANKPYTTALGVNLNGQYWLTPNWQLNANALYSHTKSNQNKTHSNQYYLGSNLLHIANAQRYYFAGIGVYHHHADNKSDTYTRPSLNLGWGQEWTQGLSTRLTTSLSKRQYAGAFLVEHKRQDLEYSASLSLWKRDWHLWGITPKLTLNWNKTDSNHFYYDNRQSTNAYLEFSKTF
ncbi:surface lipoprotein assembly modifier [Rappaport israeli]|uniref:surface lipoprotein assembly modifier n=1 Tax=Rappaport israeli TaxID=1839807 RepID=UPI000931E883|nr:surface lipoprotein assembly modifier [Rappaport israeli]